MSIYMHALQLQSALNVYTFSIGLKITITYFTSTSILIHSTTSKYTIL